MCRHLCILGMYNFINELKTTFDPKDYHYLQENTYRRKGGKVLFSQTTCGINHRLLVITLYHSPLSYSSTACILFLLLCEIRNKADLVFQILKGAATSCWPVIDYCPPMLVNCKGIKQKLRILSLSFNSMLMQLLTVVCLLDVYSF